jgi:DNA-binding PadR family transcriptional regulator
MPVRRLPDLQAQILSILVGTSENRPLSGPELRERLAKEESGRRSFSSFYQVMARLEEASFVDGRYDDENVAGYSIKQRFYWITGEGEKALTETLEYWRERARVLGRLKGGFANA